MKIVEILAILISTSLSVSVQIDPTDAPSDTQESALIGSTHQSRIYTQIGAGSYATRHLTDLAREGMRATDLGDVRAGKVSQLNMGWSNPASLWRLDAEAILDAAPAHAWQTDPKNHTLMHDGQEYTTPAFPHVARTVIEKSDPNDLAAVFVDYEAFATTGKPRFELGFRECTPDEIELMAGCYATARSIAYEHTGRGIPVSCWNLPFRPLDERNDWDAIVDAHRAMGSQYIILNGYKTHDDPIRNYGIIAESIERYRAEFDSRGYPIPVLVALSLSTHSSRFEPIPEASLVYKALAAKSLGADVLLWLNADWYVGTNIDEIDQRFHILGGIFDEPDYDYAGGTDTD